MPSCKEVEQQHGAAGCKCVHYREQFPDCACEKETVSDYSPGPVDGAERLIRTLYSPIHINKDTGEMTPLAFDDAKKKGLSVNRREHITRAQLQAQIETKVASDKTAGRNKDGFWAVITATCEDVRGINWDARRLFSVYDTATENDPSHADVCQAFEPPPGTTNRKSLSQKIRHRLYEVFSGQAGDLDAAYEVQ